VQLVGTAQAEIVVSTIGVRKPLDYVGDTVPIPVRVFEDGDAEWVEARGGTPIPFAPAAGDAFMDWFVNEMAS